MRSLKRLLAGLLCLVMAGSLGLNGAVTANAAGTQIVSRAAGAIDLTVVFDLPQTRENVAGRGLTLLVESGGKSARLSLPDGRPAGDLKLEAAVRQQNPQGEPLTNEEQVGAYAVRLSGLPAGGAQYTLTLTGQGYVTSQTTVTLDQYDRQVVLHTNGGAFSLGDLDGDRQVDRADLDALSQQLGTAGATPYDLNGDRAVDITDLTYVNLSRGPAGQAETAETAAILSAQVETDRLVAEAGSLETLLSGEDAVRLAPAAGQPLEIPILFSRSGGVEMERVELICPDAAGAIESGTLVAELADGTVRTVPFGEARPAGVHYLSREEGQTVVAVDLGRRVAVKKITIQVTAVAGQTGAQPEFAVVTQILFLKEIGQDTAQSDSGKVKGLAAQGADGSVSLAWNSVRNVTGYEVQYGASPDALTDSLRVSVNRATVTGLKNRTAYYFRVAAVNGGWSGAPSEVVSATPEAVSPPGAPSNIRITAADRSLRVSWGSTKDASFYRLYYRREGSGSYLQFGGDMTATGAVITGLTNGTAYQVVVRAGNQAGVGPNSAVAVGTPMAEEIKMPQLPEDGRIPNSQIRSITMANPNNVNTSLCPNFSAGQVADGDPATYWVARAYWESSQFTYTFREPQDMNYAILVPYLGGNYKYALRTYVVTAKNAQGEVVLDQALYAARTMDPNQNYLVLTFPMTKGVKELSISLNEREGNGCRVSISEMAFYRSDTLAEEIAALFSDGSFTALASGVTGDKIAGLKARLAEKSSFYLELSRLQDELTLAESLLAGRQDALGLVRAGFQSRGAGLDKTGQTASALQPVGISAQAGASVAIYAQLPAGAEVSLVPTQYFGESGVWKGTPIPLTNGRNYITVPKIGSLADQRGGMLYLTYSGSHPEQIRLQVRGGTGVSAIPVLELSDWYDRSEASRREVIGAYVSQLTSFVASLSGSGDLKTDIRNATEISTPSVLLSIPADQALAGLRGVTAQTVRQMTDILYQNVLAWEDELFVACQMQGILSADAKRDDSYRYPMTTRQNIRYMRMFAGAFMYAAGDHIGIGYGSASGLMRGRPVSQTGVGQANGLFGWGIAHEIGHNMDKLGKAEITNNLYSLAIQAWDGGAMDRPTRLTNSGIWQGIRAKTAAGRPGAASNVFVQLGMYWQLHLAYDGAAQPQAFYNQFFRQWKSGAYSGYSYEDRVTLLASKTAGRDLTAFFARWGVSLSQQGAAAMADLGLPVETRAIWYLNDDARSYRLANGAPHSGTVTLSAAVSGSQVTLKAQSSQPGALLGYEIRRGGVPIGFTDTGVYIDDLGAANNLTYRYTAVPVDRLGNLGAEVSCPEVRVAHEVVVPADAYRLTREGNTLLATFQKTTAVTGLRITGAGLTGSYAVRVRTRANGPWTAACSGTLSGDSLTVYFQKPGAGPEDTRIWTYDALELSITGIPAGATVELLDYPGDRIDFYQGAAVGLLSADYRYGDRAEDVVPAGTLVVIGSYRGDPLYNTVELQARYNTTAEAQEANGTTSVERPVNGCGLLFAEIPADGAVSEISDGFFLFVPDWEAERAVNAQSGVVSDRPMEVRMVLYRTDSPNSADPAARRQVSQTLWIAFPDQDTLPRITVAGGENGGAAR